MASIAKLRTLVNFATIQFLSYNILYYVYWKFTTFR